MGMFSNLGRTLSLLRELRGKSQARVAREAGIGKSQLSKYENGKELPKLDSLEKVLGALKVGYFEFFYTLYLVDRRASDLARHEGDLHPAQDRLYVPPIARGPQFRLQAGARRRLDAAGGDEAGDASLVHRFLA